MLNRSFKIKTQIKHASRNIANRLSQLDYVEKVTELFFALTVAGNLV